MAQGMKIYTMVGKAAEHSAQFLVCSTSAGCCEATPGSNPLQSTVIFPRSPFVACCSIFTYPALGSG